MGECKSPWCQQGKIFMYPDYKWIDCPECGGKMKDKDFNPFGLPRRKDGEPCKHPGCLSHRTHPCEGCGRIGGSHENKEHKEIEQEAIAEGLPTTLTEC